MKQCIFVFLLLLTFSLMGQEDYNRLPKVSGDTLEIPHKKTIYYLIQRAWVANAESSYVGIAPFVSSIKERRIPLRQGEGVNSDFYLIEANLDLKFPLFFGRAVGSDWRKRNRITFDYNGTFRMTLDDSKPLTPGSNRVGFSWNMNLRNNRTNYRNKKDGRELIESKVTNPKFLNMMVRVLHYSNGQAPGFFYVPDETAPENFRNSYLDGDFSTNYVYLELTQGVYKKALKSLHQASLGYRYDFGSEETVLAFSQEQEMAYGRHRLLAKYDYRTERFGKKFEYHMRTELEYILGNLSSFRPNLEDDSKKYRFGIKGIFELAPKNHRSVGYFLSAYFGRDYLNIRYDDIVYSIQAGVTLSLDKYFAPKLD